MGSPKSFKDLFKNKKQIPFQGGQTIVPPPPKRQITQSQKDSQEKCKRELTEYVNNQRCIICNSQLDGGVTYQDANLYCVADNKHYICKYVPNKILPVSYSAIYRFNDQAVGYMVGGYLNVNNLYNNSVYQLDLNLIERLMLRDKKLVLGYEGALLKFPPNLSYEDFVKKLKLYTAFH